MRRKTANFHPATELIAAASLLFSPAGPASEGTGAGVPIIGAVESEAGPRMAVLEAPDSSDGQFAAADTYWPGLI